MSKTIRDQINESKQDNTLRLTEYETSFIKELVVLLQYHVAKDQIIRNLLALISSNRGYTPAKGNALKFALDLDESILTIEEEKI